MLLPRERLAELHPSVEIDAVLQPARDVGGDLYDAFASGDGRLCVLIGDVTGKGVPASLFMALTKASSRSILMREGSLEAAMTAIDAELSRDNGRQMAVSMLVVLLHPVTGVLEMCSAGHEHPFVFGPDGSVEELRPDGGPPLCVADGFPYPVDRTVLLRGEALLLVTDGVTEAHDPSEDLFGRERTRSALRRASPGEPLRSIVDRLVEATRGFEAGGEPSDDLTIVALRRR